MDSYRYARRVVITLALNVGLTASAVSPSRCPLRSSDQPVSPDLVTLETRVESTHLRRGQPLSITLTLRAGSKGVFLPNSFDDFMLSCEHGFAASLLTARGNGTDLNNLGCAIAKAYSPDDTAQNQLELKKYVYLAPAETRSWHTTVSTAYGSVGLNCVDAEYLSFGYMMDAVSQLPEVAGNMAKGHILATQVAVYLRR